MKSSHYLAIAVRLFAIALFIYGLRQLLPIIELVISGSINGMVVSPFFAVVIALIPIVFSIVLWTFPLSLSRSILKTDMDREVAPLSQDNWLVVILIGIGLYTLYYGLVDSIYWIYVLHISSENAMSDVPLLMGAGDKANLVISIMEVVTSMIIILRSKTISNLILKISK